MGTHPIFESDFDCLTETAVTSCRETGLRQDFDLAPRISSFKRACRKKARRNQQLRDSQGQKQRKNDSETNECATWSFKNNQRCRINGNVYEHWRCWRLE